MKTPTFSVEVITLPVSNVERALRFYVDQVGFTLDVDYSPNDVFRVVQLTPPGSSCSIQIGKGLTDAPVGSVRNLTEFGTMERAWKSVLVQPGRYRLVSPYEVLPFIGLSDHTDTWLDWLAKRYVDGNAFELEMARGFYGYGRWDAPYWFIGPEPGMGPNQPAGNAPLLNAWLKSGKCDLCDCYEFQASIPDLTWHTGQPPLQATWSKLILLLMTYLGQPADNDSLRAYQRDRFGRSVSGETCVIELFGLAAKSLKTSKNQGQYRQERSTTSGRKCSSSNPNS